MVSGSEQLEDVFSQFAWKFLKMVDLPGRGSNQHEIGGLNALGAILGRADRRQETGNAIRTVWRTFDDLGSLAATRRVTVSWYDTRRGNPARSAEWRLYYASLPGDGPLDDARPGDLLLVADPAKMIPEAVVSDAELICYVVPAESSLFREVLWALEVSHREASGVRIAGGRKTSRTLDVLRREVLERLEPDVVFKTVDDTLIDLIEREFASFLENPAHMEFPSTLSLASFARRHLEGQEPASPDSELLDLLDVESRAFYFLEEAQLEVRLARTPPFDTVDEFISFSLSVQNRRKSRRGRSLELHLASIFSKHRLLYEEQAKVDGTKVDFLFPSAEAYVSYRKSGQPPVMMLGAKSSCKDRWRQILQEAPALDVKYLFTLEGGISAEQTRQMGEARLNLVVPESFIDTFSDCGTSLFSLSDFVELVAIENGVREM